MVAEIASDVEAPTSRSPIMHEKSVTWLAGACTVQVVAPDGVTVRSSPTKLPDSTIPVALVGPLLPTVKLKPSSSPSMAGSGAADTASETLARSSAAIVSRNMSAAENSPSVAVTVI